MKHNIISVQNRHSLKSYKLGHTTHLKKNHTSQTVVEKSALSYCTTRVEYSLVYFKKTSQINEDFKFSRLNFTYHI